MDRRHRLRSARDFARALSSGTRGQSDGVVCVARAGGSGPPRVGVRAGRRLGGAVARNRVKRLLREAVRPLLVAVPEGTDVILSATPAVAGKSFHSVREHVRAALIGAGVPC